MKRITLSPWDIENNSQRLAYFRLHREIRSEELTFNVGLILVRKAIALYAFSMFIFKKSGSPFISIPILSLIIFYGLYFSAYPHLSTIYAPQQAIKIIALIAAILIPLIGSKIYHAKGSVSLGIWIFFTISGIFFEKGGYEGNQNLGIAGHFFGFQVAATLATAGYIAFRANEIPKNKNLTRNP